MNDSLELRVSSVLKTNPHLLGRTLRFENREGRVILRGMVRSYYQKQMAQEALKQVEGLAGIENELEVCWS